MIKKYAADTASIRVLTTDVSKLKDDILAYEKLSKENSDSAQKMVDQLLDHVHKLMLNIDSIKELKDYVVTVKEETSKQICTVGKKVNKMEGNIEEIADEMNNRIEELKDYVDTVKEGTSKQICTVGTKFNKMEGEFEDRLKNVEKQQHILRASK